MNANPRLEPGNHALLLIDHQYLQLLTLRSHEASQVITNATAVAKAAKIFDVPTLLTTAFAERQNLIKESRTSSPSRPRSTVPPSTVGKTGGS
jgi:nicotinamidase-related amidase